MDIPAWELINLSHVSQPYIKEIQEWLYWSQGKPSNSILSLNCNKILLKQISLHLKFLRRWPKFWLPTICDFNRISSEFHTMVNCKLEPKYEYLRDSDVVFKFDKRSQSVR